MQIKDVWVVTSDNGTELYDDEKEAYERAFEMIITQSPDAIVDFFETLKLEMQQKILYNLQGFDRYNTNVEKV